MNAVPILVVSYLPLLCGYSAPCPQTGNLVQKMAYANTQRLMRLFKLIYKVFMQNFPSPFKVVMSACLQ